MEVDPSPMRTTWPYIDDEGPFLVSCSRTAMMHFDCAKELWAAVADASEMLGKKDRQNLTKINREQETKNR